MKKSNSESDLIPLDHTPHSRAFVRKLNSPEYQERRTAEILADNEIETLMEEIGETKPSKIVKEENNFIKKVDKTRPAPVDRDFHELAKRVKRGGKKTRKRRKVTRRRKLKKKKSTRKKRRGGVAPPGPRRPTNQPVERPPLTRTPRLPSMFEIRDPLEQISSRRYSYENSENFINTAFDILTDFDTMVYVVSRSGHTSPYDDTPLDDFFHDVIINNFSTAVDNDSRHVDTIRRRLRMGTEQIGNIINAIQRNEGALTPREGALRPSEKIQRYMDLLATLGDDPMDVEGGKRRKNKKSTRKKKRGGVGPSVPPVSRGNQTRRSRVRYGPALLQGLNQLRNMDSAYIGVAMERLSNPDLVLSMDQEGTLDDVMERVTERITFFINRNQQNIEQLRDFLDETTEVQQTLDRADSNLGDRYRNFIEQLRRLTN